MNSYIPSKGDLVRIKQVPYWTTHSLHGGYTPTGHKHHEGLIGNIFEVAGPFVGGDNGEFTLVDTNGRYIGPAFPNDLDYFEVVFTV